MKSFKLFIIEYNVVQTLDFIKNALRRSIIW